MKAAQLEAVNTDYKINEIPKPAVGPGDLLLSIKASGLCHTDLQVISGEFKAPKLPIVPSHEPCGVVAEVGQGVTKFKVGDRVGAIGAYKSCHKCADCKNGQYIYCSGRGGMCGITRDGAMAEYCIVDSESSVLLPDMLSFTSAAPLFCAGATAYQAILKAKQEGLPDGGVLGIVGIGGLGHIGIQLAAVAGYKVIAVDSRQEPLDLVNRLKLKPFDVINSSSISASAAKAKITSTKGYPGCDAVIVMTEPVPAFQYGTGLLAKHGVLVVVGQPKDMIPFSFYEFVFNDIKVVGTLLAERDTVQDMVNLIAEHDIHVETTEWKLEDCNEMVKAYNTGKTIGKHVVVFD